MKHPKKAGIPGGNNVVIGSRDRLTRDPSILADRLKARGIHTKLIWMEGPECGPQAPVAEGGPVGFFDWGEPTGLVPRGPGERGALRRRRGGHPAEPGDRTRPEYDRRFPAPLRPEGGPGHPACNEGRSGLHPHSPVASGALRRKRLEARAGQRGQGESGDRHPEGRAAAGHPGRKYPPARRGNVAEASRRGPGQRPEAVGFQR